MLRTNSQAKIVSEELLVPRANRLVIKKNNQRVASDSHIIDTMLRFVVEILRHHKLYKPVSLTTTTLKLSLSHLDYSELYCICPPDPNNTYIKPPSENQILEFIKTFGYDEDPETKMIAVFKMVAAILHQPWRAILVYSTDVLRDPRRDTVRLPILQILWGIVYSANLDFASLIWDEFECDYKFGMEVPDAMNNDAIKKKAGYTYYMAKKVESKKAKNFDEPEDQHVSPVKNGRGKGFMCYGDQVANVPNKLKKVVVPRKTRSLTIAKEAVIDTANDATLYSLSLDKSEESANEINDANESDMDLFDDNPHKDDDDARYGVFMHNKSTITPDSTYLGPTVISSSLDFIRTFLDETPANELTDFMSHSVCIDAETTSVVHNPEGNPELTSYISGNVLGQECSSHTISTSQENSLSYNNSTTKLPTSQSKEADAKDEKNIRKFNFKKAVTHKFKEYDKKLEALTNFNVSESLEKSIQAKVLTKIKKLLPTHIVNVIANYVKPRLNTSVLEVMKTNLINLFTQSSTSTDDLLELDLKLKLLNRIHLNKSNDTHTTHQQLYDTLYESIILNQDVLDAKAVQSSFHKRSYDNQDPPNNHEGENKKKHQTDVSKPSSRSSRQNRSPVVIVQDDTHAMTTTWFDLFFKSDIDKDENHILGPSTVTKGKQFKELIQKDELSIANLEGAGLERLKVQYNNDVELKYHVSQLKAAVLSEA
ncbi:hypothetical protein Tco_0659829 [Tanacetum coccineum]